MNQKFLLSLLTLTLFLSVVSSLADPDVANMITTSGFEDDASNYFYFVAGDSTAMNCKFTESKDAAHSGTMGALIKADDFARCSIGPKVPVHPLANGERYRIGVWIKARADFQAQPGSPGVVLRLNTASGYPPTGMTSLVFINLDKTVSCGIAPNPTATPLPTDWTHLEGVVDVPAGADSMGVSLFMWKAKGSLYVDDFTFEKVDASTPATPVVPGPAQ